MNEEFRDIIDFPNYQISNFGNVYSKNKNSLLTPCDDSRGYLMVHLWKNNQQYAKKIHRLVAETFLENPKSLQDVNHKDENKHNNNVSNLEWVTRKDNINYGTRSKRQALALSKAIYQINKETLEIIQTFNSARDAERITGINNSNISQVCQGKRKTAGGFIWCFAKEDY